MKFEKKVTSIIGWLVFIIAFVVYIYSVERTGSLWDCGEFITGAYKLEVVHPPGAPLFLLIGRVFTFLATVFSDNPENIAFSVNLMSGMFTAFAAMLIAWVTMILGRLTLVNRGEEINQGQLIALSGAGLVAGLSTAFATSIWFSAVEGEVYAMSTFFTTLTLWAVVKWYSLPDIPKSDRWLVFAIYAAGLSIGVHLLSILTFPALALFYYFKKYKKHNFLGIIASAGVGVAFIMIVQKVIITGIPTLWKYMDLMMVNGFGLPFHSGLIPTILIIGGIIWFGIRYAHRTKRRVLEIVIVGALMTVIGFSTIGVIVIRANVDTPINMNRPSDAMRLLPYLNREQYGERSLLYGPTFEAQPAGNNIEERYGRLGDRYELVDEKISYNYNTADKMLFPRMSDNTQGRPDLYRQWVKKKKGEKITFSDNIKFFFRYQLNWMYWRYFMWNFSGRQNGEQGYESWNVKNGNWISGIKFLDEARLHNMDKLPESAANNKARNKYYLLPFLFGLLGLFYHFAKDKNDATAILFLFVITGIGIIVYSNQPPREPRERDYVLAGSIFTYTIWIGMAVLSLFEFFSEKISGKLAAIIASVVIIIAPLLMGFQNFDDHTRRLHKASRDYASNFLNSCEQNAIIFTYGDNDTYPLWYAQEVEGIRTDIRVVNLSLIAVDWYIDILRRKMNDSPPLKLTISSESFRGRKRNVVPYYNPSKTDREMNVQSLLKFVNEDHPLPTMDGREYKSHLPTRNVYIQVDKNKVLSNGTVDPFDSTLTVVDKIPINIKGKSYLDKKDLAVLDVISSNLWDRPVYFAVTVQQNLMYGLQDYLQLEGLGLRIVPIKSKSDRQFSIYGSGRVATEKVYENVMNKFKWGNFDKYDLFVDRSYGPSVQSIRMIMVRTATELLYKGENEKAANMAEKYFEGFPNMNFTYDYSSFYMIRIMLQAKAYDKAKFHMKILAKEVADNLEFYESLDPADLDRGFSTDVAINFRTKDDLISAAKQMGDEELEKEFTELFAPFDLESP